MIQIKFKNLEKSEMTRQAVLDRIENLIEKFPHLNDSKIQVTLEMENSPVKSGPDLFKVKFYVARGRYDSIALEKANACLYVALAEVIDHMLEKLNRFGDRKRVKERNRARQIALEADKNWILKEYKTG